MPVIKAITWDLWDTVFVDDSDEPKRAAQGLPSKKIERRDLVQRYLERQAPVSRAGVDAAYDAVDAAFGKVWRELYVTWSVEERLRLVLAGLGRELPLDALRELTAIHQQMENRIRPDLVPGVEAALAALHARYRTVAISDAVFTPGWALRTLLESYGLLGHFDGCVFSDEVGRSKPAPIAFERAAELAGCRPDELVHIGDRESNDVAGPHAVGARAVLVTAALDRGSDGTQADAVCRDYAELPAIIARLERG
ncbi:MAG: HAD family hydrolase [Deltaproteobacteria bacterium]|nr:HAD family hydrolase [Deltaproteobacteria bacterium]